MNPALLEQLRGQASCCQCTRQLLVPELSSTSVLDFGNHIPSCRRVTFLHAVLVALPLLPSVDVSDSFSLVEAEKTHPAQSNMSQCILDMPLSSQCSLTLHSAHSQCALRGEQGGKGFLNTGLFVEGGRSSMQEPLFVPLLLPRSLEPSKQTGMNVLMRISVCQFQDQEITDQIPIVQDTINSQKRDLLQMTGKNFATLNEVPFRKCEWRQTNSKHQQQCPYKACKLILLSSLGKCPLLLLFTQEGQLHDKSVGQSLCLRMASSGLLF